MTYRIQIANAALKALDGIAKADAVRIRTKVSALALEPRPHGAETLAGSSEGRLRLRVGDYRVIYRVDDGVLVVLVITIGHRREVYR